MNKTEIEFILNKQGLQSEIGHDTTGTDGGQEHPLWTMINNRFPPPKSWRLLRGGERTQIGRAGAKLHERNIPYSFYVDFLDRVGKGYLKHTSAYAVTKYLPVSSGRPTIFGEYLELMDTAVAIYRRKPEAVVINDKVYALFPDGFKLGALQYIYSLTTIEEALKNRSPREVMTAYMFCKTITEFWHKLGKSMVDQAPVEVDLGSGVTAVGAVKLLQKEMRIRLGKDEGRPSPAFDRYFKTNGTLNVQGLKIVSGEKSL